MEFDELSQFRQKIIIKIVLTTKVLIGVFFFNVIEDNVKSYREQMKMK